MNSNLNSDSNSCTLSIEINAGPSYTGFIGAKSLTEGHDGTFTVSAATDPEGDSISYEASGTPSWLYFDPTKLEFSGNPSASPSSYSITLTATDLYGESDTTTFTLFVSANSVVSLSGTVPSQVANAGSLFAYDFSTALTATDANGDDIFFSVSGAAWIDGPSSETSSLLHGTPSSGDASSSAVTITISATDGI